MGTALASTVGKTLWDIWCCVSVIGIWPRFIEPNLLASTLLPLPIPNLHRDLEQFRLVHFTDLHINSALSDRYLQKISDKIAAAKPDMILFTGDFLCYSTLDEPERLRAFLRSLQAPYGCFAIFGNHDYAQTVSVNSDTGDYDLFDKGSSLYRSISNRFFRNTPPSGRVSEKAQKVPLHKQLCELLEKSPFVLLENRTEVVKVKEAKINICGLGEYTLGRSNPSKAFAGWDDSCPGIVLAHNPDSITKLVEYPGSLILSGHTHGCQVNLPFLRDRFTVMEQKELCRGLKRWHNKAIYINKGVGGLVRFRWRSIPEIVTVVLTRENK